MLFNLKIHKLAQNTFVSIYVHSIHFKVFSLLGSSEYFKLYNLCAPLNILKFRSA